MDSCTWCPVCIVQSLFLVSGVPVGVQQWRLSSYSTCHRRAGLFIRCRPAVENHSPASRVDSLIRGNFAGNSGPIISPIPSEWWMEWLWRWTLAATCSVRIPCRWLAGSRNLVGLPQRLPQETYLPLYVHVGRHHRRYNENMAMLWWSMVQSPHFPHQSGFYHHLSRNSSIAMTIPDHLSHLSRKMSVPVHFPYKSSCSEIGIEMHRVRLPDRSR